MSFQKNLMIAMTEEKHRNSIWRVTFRFAEKPRSKDRPFLVIIRVDDRIQGFKMTSRSWRDGDLRYYKIKDLNGTGLTEDTWIDLESVFPLEEDFVSYMGELNPEDRLGMQRQLKFYLQSKSDNGN